MTTEVGEVTTMSKTKRTKLPDVTMIEVEMMIVDVLRFRAELWDAMPEEDQTRHLQPDLAPRELYMDAMAHRFPQHCGN